jgi:PAS domain S-box-containing protein
MRSFAAIALFVGLESFVFADGAPPITTLRDIARDGPAAFTGAVRVRGVVTHFDSNRRRICIQDGGEGLVARIPTDIRPLQPGQSAELAGRFHADGVFHADDLRSTGDAGLPDATPVTGDELAAGRHANLRVAIAGVVRSEQSLGDHAILRVMAGPHVVRVFVSDLPTGTGSLNRLVDAEVRMSGVHVVHTGQSGRADGTLFLVQSLAEVLVTCPAPESPFSLPTVSANDLLESGSHRIRIAGKATGPVADGILKLQVDDQIVALPAGETVSTQVGEKFEAVGFPSRRNGVLFLDEALVRGFALRHGANELLPIITIVSELRRMPLNEINRGHPVRIRGTLTFHDPAEGDMFVHDGIEGIFVFVPKELKQIGPGSQVLIEGYSDPGEFAPSIRATRVTVLRDGRLPTARRCGHDELVGGREDCQWVEIEAVVRGTGHGDQGEALLMLRFGSSTTAATIAGTDPETLSNLFGATVRVRAVCGSKFNNRRQWQGFLFYVPSAAEIQVVRHAQADLSAIAPRTIESLSQFAPERSPSEPIKLNGRVLSRRGDTILLQDSTGGIAVELQPRQSASPGDRAEVLGYLVRRFNGWAIEDGLASPVTTPDDMPGPTDVTASDAAGGGYAATLIRVEAVLVEQFPAGLDYVFLLQSVEEVGKSRLVFPAILPRTQVTNELRELKPGTRLRVTGACGMPYDRSMIASFRVLLRDVSDVDVIEQPSSWTGKKALSVTGIVAALAIVAGAWVITLRRRVSKQTAQIRRQLAWEANLEAHYRDLFESASDAIFSLDATGHVTSMNQFGRTLTGLGDGDSFLHAVVPDSLGIARELVTSKAPITREITLTGQSAPIVLEVSVRPILNAESSAGVQAIARDLTQRRRLEADLRQAQKMEAIGRLAGGVAHDFNNLLTVINGNAEVLRSRSSKPDSSLIDEIARAGEHAASLTRQLLTFSRKGVIAPRVLCPNATVTSLRRMLGRLIGDRVELIADLDETAGSIRIDPGQLEQVLVNLAINARDAMPNGGSLTLRTRGRPEHVRIEVIDTGTGMDKPTLARAFEPFFTTKPDGEGTGLGLATVKSIVEGAGGTIGVFSEPGRGVAFTIEFPLSEDTPLTPIPSPVLPPPANREVILLVEDEPAVQLLERRVLEMARYVVLTASNGGEALGVFERYQGRIDLLVTDVVMPGMSGRELAELIGRRRPNLPTLFLSGYTPDEVLKEGVRAEEAHFLQKPFTPSGLLQKVRDVLSGMGSSNSRFGSKSDKLAATY